MRALYVTHPEVSMDPNVPVPLWGLSAPGRRRAEAFAERLHFPKDTVIFSSRERKALELADLLAERAGTVVLSDSRMGENDRSSTGFLPPLLFEQMADRFFSQPHQSAEGWERAIDAQARIVETVHTALASIAPGTPAIFCGHGAVGTLLKCYLADRPIARSEDQSRHAQKGGGNCFAFSISPKRLGSEWTAMEDWPADWMNEAVEGSEQLA